MRTALCIPVFDDWRSAHLLLERLDAVCASIDHPVDVLFVDDGSTDEVPAALSTVPSHLAQVSVLVLRRNVGHQRAITIGLTHLFVHGTHDAVVVMDGDGEDDPRHVVDLLARLRELGRDDTAVFAKRSKRLERLSFRLGYLAFKFVHLLLTGKPVEVGNFSVIPRRVLARLVGVSEMWNHYSAAVTHARVPIVTVPLPRARRLAGQSKMNLVALVGHGFGAISVLGDVIGVRLLLVTAGLGAISVLGIAGAGVAHYGMGVPIAGWALPTLGMLLLALLNLTLISMGLAIFVRQARSNASFLPLRDYAHFILEERTLRG